MSRKEAGASRPLSSIPAGTEPRATSVGRGRSLALPSVAGTGSHSYLTLWNWGNGYLGRVRPEFPRGSIYSVDTDDLVRCVAVLVERRDAGGAAIRNVMHVCN